MTRTTTRKIVPAIFVFIWAAWTQAPSVSAWFRVQGQVEQNDETETRSSENSDGPGSQESTSDAPDFQSGVPAIFRRQLDAYPDLSRVQRVFGYPTFEHEGQVLSVTLLNGGKTLLTTTNRHLTWWNIAEHTVTRRTDINAMNHAPVVETADPDRILVSADQGLVQILDAETGERIATISEENWLKNSYICDADVSSDGKVVALGTRRWTWSEPRPLPGGEFEKPIVVSEGGLLLRTNFGKRLYSDQAKKDATLAVRWIPDSQIIAAGRYCGRVDFIDDEGELMFPSIKMPGRRAAAGIDISADGKQIAVTSTGGSTGLWNISEEQPVWFVKTDADPPSAPFRHTPAAIRFAGERLLIGADRFLVRSLADGSVIADPFQHPVNCTAFDFDIESNLIAVATGFSVQLLSFDSLQPLSGSSGPEAQENGLLTFSPAEDSIAFVNGNQISFWNPSELQPRGALSLVGTIEAVSWSLDGNFLGCAWRRDRIGQTTIDLIDVINLKIVKTIPLGNVRFADLAVSAEAKTMVVLSPDSIAIHDLEFETEAEDEEDAIAPGKNVEKNAGKNEHISFIEVEPARGDTDGHSRMTECRISPDGKILVVAVRYASRLENGIEPTSSSVDGIQLYEIASGKHLANIDTPGDTNKFEFSADSKFLYVSGGPQITVQGMGFPVFLKYDARTGDEEVRLYKTRSVTSPANFFSMIPGRDEVVLVEPLGSTISIWDVASAEELRQWTVPFSGVRAIHVTQDGKLLYLNDQSGATLVIDISE